MPEGTRDTPSPRGPRTGAGAARARAAMIVLLAASTLHCGDPAPDRPASTTSTGGGTDALAIVGASVLQDPMLDPMDDATVVVEGGRISALGPRRSIQVPEDARVVSGEGKWLLPGLRDMHVHLTDATELAMPVLLANRITGVRDMGGDVEIVADMERRRLRGELDGPRIFTPGPYLDGPKRGLPHRVTVESADEGRAAVEVSPVAAARAGQASLEHFVTLFEGTLRDRTSDPEKIRGYMENGLDTLIRDVAATDAYLTPTAYTYQLRARRGELARDPDPRRRPFPRGSSVPIPSGPSPRATGPT